MAITPTKTLDTCSTVFKALDALTILTARDEGIPLPDLALALNQPRTNVVRLVRTLQNYGFVACRGRRWMATATFRRWSTPSDRHLEFRRRYQSTLAALAATTGELVMLGLHEGNGIIHIDAIQSAHRLCRMPAPGIRHSLRFSALGKLALSRRPDLAIKFPEPAFQAELDEIRRTGVAWNRLAPIRGLVGMAIPGFTNLPTEPMLAITWPEARFNEEAAANARQAAREAMEAFAREAEPEQVPWTDQALSGGRPAVSVA